MMPHRLMNREEQALDEFLAATDETVAVVLTESFHPGAQLMGERVRVLGEGLEGFHSIVVGLESYRTWAERHHVQGTPAILLFRDGQLRRRVNGVFAEEHLAALLRIDWTNSTQR